MKHARQKIREQVATMLSAISGVTVERSRAYSIVTPPHISIFANGENSDLENGTMPSPVRYSRQLQLEIEITVEQVDNADDQADDYAAQVEAILAADDTLGGYATESRLRNTTVDIDGQSDTPVVSVRLIYEVWYRTTGPDPETPL